MSCLLIHPMLVLAFHWVLGLDSKAIKMPNWIYPSRRKTRCNVAGLVGVSKYFPDTMAKRQEWESP